MSATAPATHPPKALTSVTNPVAAVLGVAVVAGVYADGYAHVNIGGLETFFTPWHATLYGAFAVLAAWIGAAVRRRHRTAGSWRVAVPPGYGWGLAGIATFTTGGLLDMGWHIAFGIEAGLEALLSPTHLILLVGGVLVLSSPLRAALAAPSPSRSQLWSGVLSAAAVAGLAAFFLSYVSVFADTGAGTPLRTVPEGAPGRHQAELPAVAGLADYLVSTLLLVLPVIFLRRAGRLPGGAVVAVTAAVTVPPAVLGQLQLAVPTAGALLGAATVDLLVGHRSLTLLAAALPGAVWAGQLAGLAVTGHLAWPVELWAGVTVLTVLEGLALVRFTEPAGALAPAPHEPAEAPTQRSSAGLRAAARS